MRLIDADALAETLAIVTKKMAKSEAQQALMGRVLYILDHKHEAVVRCRECKHYHDDLGWCDKLSYFQLPDGEPCSPAESMEWKMFNGDDFCSYGERKDGEGNG